MQRRRPGARYQDLIERQLADCAQPLIEVLAFEQLHDDERRAVFVGVKVGDLHNVRVAEGRDRARFILKALVNLGIGSGLAVQDLTANMPPVRTCLAA